MNRNFRIVLAASLLAGILAGLTVSQFHQIQHRITLFGTGDRIETYMDGEMLNDAAAMLLDRPEMNLILKPVQRNGCITVWKRLSGSSKRGRSSARPR